MNKKGFALIVAMTFLTVFFVGGSSYLYMTTNELKHTERQLDRQKAFFLAEAGIERGIWRVKNSNIVNAETFQLKGDQDPVNYLEDENINVTITDLGGGSYQVISTSQVGTGTKTLNVIVQKGAPSRVFDYGYFINNWGWFYGSGITAKGDVRSNGRFDFRSRPRVDGEICAGYEIYDGGQGIRGKGGNPENQHPFSEKLDMPNLYDLSYYEDKARTRGGSIVVDGTTLIEGIFGDDEDETGNIVLVGTSSKPIEINGTVVVRGDVVIKGVIKGQGVIYAGRNIYVADDIRYKNAPSSPRPSGNNPSAADNWVNAHKDNDLVGFGAAENIIMGDYTGRTGGSWYSNYWLFGMGDEDVGQDGIPDTNDLYEDDGVFQSQYEDLDGDGVKDGNYNWSDIRTQVPISEFTNCPNSVRDFRDVADNALNRMDGIFYTNHAFAGRAGYGMQINGSIISKDEAIVYRNTITVNYDERIHSRYTSGEERFIDVDLPISKSVDIIRWW
ncbi:MAG: pilus assembly PilX N-terminal domain-containing protein [Candidatus Omnitrophica bacterium]|nr:pilus assembly PilX N-terminal domain-containing protein [Candidatus Omnitrophota bacterium]